MHPQILRTGQAAGPKGPIKPQMSGRFGRITVNLVKLSSFAPCHCLRLVFPGNCIESDHALAGSSCHAFHKGTN